MKHLSLLAAALVATAPLVAQFVAESARATEFIPAQSDTEYLARDHLIGAKVHGSEGTIVGDVEDLIVSDDNRIVGVVMGIGGYFGFAEKKVGVPLSSLKFDEKDGTLFVSIPDLSKEALDGAPAYERKKPAKSLFERAKEKVNEYSDKTKSTTSDAIDAAKPALDDAKRRTQEALDKAKEAAKPAIDRAKEAVSDALDKAKKSVDEATTSTEPETPVAPTEPSPVDPAPATPEAPAAPEQPTEL